MSVKKAVKSKISSTTQILSTLKRLESGQIDIVRQVQDQRADIIKMKEEILGAFDASSRVPDVSAKVDLHEKRIENLEQKSTMFEAALRGREKPLDPL
jgi:hypothetical protein